MFLTRLSTLYIFWLITFDTCCSRHWTKSRSRTVRKKRPNDYDNDQDYTMVMRKTIAKTHQYSSGPMTILQEEICPLNTFVYEFQILWTWARKPANVEPCVYGIQLKCEIGTEILLMGTAQEQEGSSKYYRTGRISRIKYWTVNEKIYKISMTGSFRTSVWETSQWPAGTKRENIVNCAANHYIYLLKGWFVGHTSKPDYLADLHAKCK